jgi:hypothetical protein
LVRGGGGGGGGGGGRGGGGFSGGGRGGFSGGGRGGFSGGGRSFSPAISGGGNVGARSFSGNSFANGSRSFGANSFANGNRSFSNRIGYDGYNRGGWNNGNWAWRGNYGYGRGYGGGWWGYPLGAWLGGYGWWYPGYDYGYYPYDYYGDDYAYNTAPSYTAVEPPNNPMTQADQGGNEYLDQAMQAFQAGNYQEAMRFGEHAIVDSPKDAEAHEVVSLAAFALKDYRTAATEAHAVIALGGVPSWSQVYAIYQNADAYTSQLRALEDYAKANPKSAEAQFLLGVQYMTTGYTSDAHEHLVQAAQLTPRDKIAQELVKGVGGEQPSTANRPGAPQTK